MSRGAFARAMDLRQPGQRGSRPLRPARRRWGRLHPAGDRSRVDLLPADPPDGLGVLYAMLDAGLVEAWGDGEGHVRLRWPDEPLA